jgi:phosphoribosylamine--glycine ligase
VSEYSAAKDEAAHIRSLLLSPESGTMVVLYDLELASFVGTSSVSEILGAYAGGSEGAGNTKSALAAASLQALAELDVLAMNQIVGPSKRQDVVVVVGSGGREHALAVALAKSPLVAKVICCPGNGGTARDPSPKIVNQGSGQDNATVIKLAKDVGAKMVVVGPEAPLVDGLVDAMKVECPNVLCFGPTKAAAELEASKAFTKDFLHEHNIPTAKYRTFTNAHEALKYVESLEEGDRQVVKASGLAAGKGVLIPTTKQETLDAVKEIMSDKSFGNAGDTCVIESFMIGPEASCFALCDGKTCVMMPAAQDHKRALDNDEGLNTGGMGAYAPAPCVTPDLQAEIFQMCKTTVEKMAERGTPYVGLLYAGLM